MTTIDQAIGVIRDALELARQRDAAEAKVAELEAALAERDRELQSCRSELEEAREKVDLLMQPVPEVHGDFPWQMMRLWCANYAREKRRWREDVAERDRRIVELEEQTAMACETPADNCDCSGCSYAAEVQLKGGG